MGNYRGAKNYRRRRTYRKNTRTRRNKQLVDKTDGQPRFLKMINSGLPYVAAIPSIAKTLGGVIAAINTEHKFHDADTTDSFYNADPVFMQLNGIAQGDDYTNRIGRSIRAINLTLRWTTTMNASTVDESYRMLIVCDKMLDPDDGETPSQIVTKLLQDTTNPVLSPINREYSDRFVILKEKMYSLSDGQGTRAFNKVFLRLGFHIKFDGTTQTLQSANSLYFILLSDNANSTNPSSCEVYSRLNYTDN